MKVSTDAASRSKVLTWVIAGAIAGAMLVYFGGRLVHSGAREAAKPTNAGEIAAQRERTAAAVDTEGGGAPSSQVPIATLPGYCGSLDGVTALEGGGSFAWGWAYDPRSGTPASEVILVENGRRLPAAISMGLERPDVPLVTGNPRLGSSGWNARLPPSSRPEAGEQVLEAYALFADGASGRLAGRPVVPPRTGESAKHR